MNEQTRKKTGKLMLMAQVPIAIIAIFIFSQINTAFGSESVTDKKLNIVPGFNTEIPKPNTKNEMNKLSLIRKAKEDSIRASKNKEDDFGIFDEPMDSLDMSRETYNEGPDQKVARMQDKLDRISAELEKKQRQAKLNKQRTQYGNEYSATDYQQQNQYSRSELSDIDALVGELDNVDVENANNAELDEVNKTMDKLAKVMNMAHALETGKPLDPEMSKDKETSERESFEVKKFNGGFSDENSVEFHGFSDSDPYEGMDNTFKASFFNSQTLMSGSTVKIKLDEAVQIKDVVIPKNSFLYGKVSISGDRLRLTINSMRLGDYLFPVSLTAYDYDGLEGIHVPGSIQRELAKKEAGSSIRGMNFSTYGLDDDVTDKAIESGSNFLKDMFSRKVRAVKVTVRPHHKILLKNQ
jgi:conjugative transposon TraM protein